MISADHSATCWVNGAAQSNGHTFAVLNPSTGEILAEAVDADTGLIDEAITAAHGAFDGWATQPASKRAALLAAWADLIEDHRDELAALVSQEAGKLVREARGEVGAGVDAIRWSAEQAVATNTTELASPGPNQRHFTTTEPVGVVACITPWNFPIAAVLVKVGAAVAAGCTTVVKPSEETPLVASALARLATEAGLPAGVINVVTTAAPSRFGDAIASRSDVRGISFTGSTRVGRHLYAQCAPTVKRMALELGGNAPFIVFGDADLDRAASHAINARFYNAGQICVGANRFFIHESVYDDFAERLTEKVAALQVGDVGDDATDVGPLINRAAKDRVESLITDAVDNGAAVTTGGLSAEDSGNAVQPTVLTNVTESMKVYSSEIFGPVACLYRFSSTDDVVQRANDTEAGLAAYAYSTDAAFLSDVGARLDAGVIGLNTTAIFAREPGSRAAERIWMTSSEISGTSILNNSISISGHERDRINCGPRLSVLISFRIARTRSLTRNVSRPTS